MNRRSLFATLTAAIAWLCGVRPKHPSRNIWDVTAKSKFGAQIVAIPPAGRIVKSEMCFEDDGHGRLVGVRETLTYENGDVISVLSTSGVFNFRYGPDGLVTLISRSCTTLTRG